MDRFQAFRKYLKITDTIRFIFRNIDRQIAVCNLAQNSPHIINDAAVRLYLLKDFPIPAVGRFRIQNGFIFVVKIYSGFRIQKYIFTVRQAFNI